MKLELKHLAPYLPYGLNGRFTLSEVIQLSSSQKDEIRDKKLIAENVNFFLNYCTPILRPLSDLQDELTDIFIEVYSSKDDVWLSKMSKKGNQVLSWSNDNGFGLNTASGEVQIFKNHELVMPYKMIEGAFKRHIDINKLIEKGLAIDKNTLK